MNSREAIIARIRAAQGEPTPERRAEAKQYIRAHREGPRPKAEWDLAARFRERVLALASTFEEIVTIAEAPGAVARYLNGLGLPLDAVCWPDLAGLDWQAAEIRIAGRQAEGSDLVGITGAFCAIAETGTLVLLSGPRSPASVSLVPETHIAILPASRIVKGMEEAWALVRAEFGPLPRAVNLVSGPSRTGDIEQTITLGAHGPYRVHIILVKDE